MRQLNVLEIDLILNNISGFLDEKDLNSLISINNRIYSALSQTIRLNYYKNTFINQFKIIISDLEKSIQDKNIGQEIIGIDLDTSTEEEIINIYKESIQKIENGNNKNEIKQIIKFNLDKINKSLITRTYYRRKYILTNIIYSCLKPKNKIIKNYFNEIELMRKHFKIVKHLYRGFFNYFIYFQIYAWFITIMTICIISFLKITIRFKCNYIFAIPGIILLYVIFNTIKIIIIWRTINYKKLYDQKYYNSIMKGNCVTRLIFYINIITSLPHLLFIYPIFKYFNFELKREYHIIPELYFYEYKRKNYKYINQF